MMLNQSWFDMVIIYLCIYLLKMTGTWMRNKKKKKKNKNIRFSNPTALGQTLGAPYRGYGYVPLRFGGTSLRMGTQQQPYFMQNGQNSMKF